MYSKFREAPAIRLTKVNRVAVFNLYLMAVLLLWYLMLVVSCICRINALRRSLLYFLFITSWGVHYTTSNPLVSIYISIRFIFWNIWAPLILVYNVYFIMCKTLIGNIEYTCYLKYLFIHSVRLVSQMIKLSLHFFQKYVQRLHIRPRLVTGSKSNI